MPYIYFYWTKVQPQECNIQSCHEASPFSFFYGDKDHISEPEPVPAVPLDPGGSIILHCLGGKPKLKKGGMSGTAHGWAFIWAMCMGLEQLPVDHWKSTTRERRAAAGEGIEYLEYNCTVHLPPLVSL